MGLRSLSGKVAEAEIAAADTLQHGAVLDRIAPPPIRPDLQRIADTTLSAMSSAAGLISYGRGLDSRTPAPREEGRPPIPRGTVGGRPIPTFEQAAQGHAGLDEGCFYKGADDAREHSDFIITTAQGNIDEHPPPASLALSSPADDLARVAMEGPGEEHAGMDAGRVGRINGWLDEAYLGAAVFGRFSSMPPILTVEAPAFFELANAAEGNSGGGNGLYSPGTNHIMITSAVANPADRMCLIVHETLHYAAYLGGGHDGMRYMDSQGNPTVLGHIPWLHEGLTELHAQQLVRSHGTAPSYVGYPAETLASYYLQQIAGADTLRTAFLTGDFTPVRRAVDARLGEGTFAALGALDGGAEALNFLQGRMDARRVDRSEWDRNPIPRIARLTLASDA